MKRPLLFGQSYKPYGLQEAMIKGAARGGPRVRAGLLAFWIWSASFGLILTALFTHHVSTIPYGVYAGAGRRWLDSQPLYELKTIDGFQYFPQAAMLFAPLAWLGSPLGDVTWRALSWCGYACGLWRLAHQLLPLQAQKCFLLATCCAVACATDSLGNGQANLALAALMAHANADLAQRRWNRAAALLIAGLCLKPLMLVLVLLVWTLYPKMLWRIALACAIAFAAPWLLRDNAYVVTQYGDALAKLRLCAAPDRLFEDLRSLNLSLGLHWGERVYTSLRVLGAVGVFALCVWARQTVSEPYRSLFVSAFAASYLMLFNPRTLSSSYAMPMSAAALLTAVYLLECRKRGSLLMLAIVGSWTVNYHQLASVQHWLRPLACVGFVGMLVAELLRRQQSTQHLAGPEGDGLAVEQRARPA
jgi:alpha-1,2-mannosyltransferase